MITAFPTLLLFSFHEVRPLELRSSKVLPSSSRALLSLFIISKTSDLESQHSWNTLLVLITFRSAQIHTIVATPHSTTSSFMLLQLEVRCRTLLHPSFNCSSFGYSTNLFCHLFLYALSSTGTSSMLTCSSLILNFSASYQLSMLTLNLQYSDYLSLVVQLAALNCCDD